MGGIVAGFATLAPDRWDDVLSRISVSGVEVIDMGEERGTHWYICRRELCELDLGFNKNGPHSTEPGPHAKHDVTMWYPFSLRRPLAMRRLYGDVRSAVLASGGKDA
jgi:hypothetical protein